MAKKKSEKEIKLKSQKKKSITITLDIDLLKKLDKRADKNFLSLKEQVEDIVRRSMLSYNKRTKTTVSEPDVEKMVKIFSRKKPGRKAKK